uniref:Uncharacterized protein LOC105052164 n=1 Tax=Elaeis guineensis var. tenera TaxID=51953 RepID=A0A6I9RRC0_ELAGV|nr:uncharacterized protein LOC105052164 [Elaeis guineensis]
MQTEARMRAGDRGVFGHCAAVEGGILRYSSAHPYQQNGQQRATTPAADRDGGAPVGGRRCRRGQQDQHGSTSLPHYSISVWSQHGLLLDGLEGHDNLIPPEKLIKAHVRRQIQEADSPESSSSNDKMVQPAGPGYQLGASTDSHHTIDLQTWNNQHPKPPS